MKKFLVFTLTIILAAINTQSLASTDLYRVNDLRMLFAQNKAIIYVINIRTFNAKDNNNNDIIEPEKGDVSGSFVNAINRLDDLANQGINTIELLPITPVGKVKATGTAGSLFAISDFSSLNQQLIDSTSTICIDDQARCFVNECHKRGIRVIVDLPCCGSYDLYIKSPELFLLDKKAQPVIPADWTDVRLFKTVNDDGSLNDEIYELHKQFIDYMQSLGIDGVRASNPSIKPYEFWAQLIKYAREKDPQFLFLAESSQNWTSFPSEYVVFTDYKKLLDAGFDAYYGGYSNFKNWKSVNDLKNEVTFNYNLFKQYKEKKSVIGSFSTHDELSPVLTGGENYNSMLMWLSATLPLNPYYIDGFSTGDCYLYSYANKKADKTYTDDDYYYVHKGKMDIFNLSRRPEGNNLSLFQDFFLSLKLRQFAQDTIIKGNFKTYRSDNPSVFCYSRSFEAKSIIVILNKDLHEKMSAKINISSISPGVKIIPIKAQSSPKIEKGKILVDLTPGEIIVLFAGELKL